MATAACVLALAVAVPLVGEQGRASAAPTQSVSPSPPNILVIVTDDQPTRLFNRTLMPQTFSRLVDKGARFDRFYVNTPLCCPSRAQLLTGLRGHHTGVDVNRVPLTRPTVVQALKTRGYRTVLAGKYLNSMPCAQPAGFERWACVGPGIDGYTMVDPRTNVNGTWQQLRGYSTDLQADFIGDVIDATPAGQPVFAMYSPTSPHLPADDPRCAAMPVTFLPSGTYDEETRVGDKPAYLRRPPLGAGEKALIEDEYVRMSRATRCLDGSIARLLDRLGERAADTAVFFTSDNGYLYGEHRRYTKGTPYEEDVRVPLVVRYPRWLPESSAFRTPSLAENVDLTATVAELAGISWSGDGASLGPVIRRETGSVREKVLVEHCQGATHPCPWTNFASDGAAQTTVPSIWAIVTSRYKYMEHITGDVELYDLAVDGGESTNLAGNPVLASTQEQLAASLAGLRADPPPDTTIVTGPRPAPASRTVSFSYFAKSRAAAYVCRLDGAVAGSWRPCNGEFTRLGPLADGDYTFQVAGSNASGVRDPSPAKWSFGIHATGPAVSITSAPARDSATRSVSIGFSSSTAGATFQCRLSPVTSTNGAWNGCSSPFKQGNLADGSWSFEVRALSKGEVSAPPAQAIFRVSTSGPAMIADSEPRHATSATSARYVFHPDEETAGPLTCRLDGGHATDCSLGVFTAAGLSQGRHALVVYATDLSGTARATTFGWVVDSVPPKLSWSKGPSSPTASSEASFDLTANEAVESLFCKLDKAHAYTPCPRPMVFSGLQPGWHVLSVVGVDPARNFSPSLAWTWEQAIVDEPTSSTATSRTGAVSRSPPEGYWLGASDGGIFAFGPRTPFSGSAGDLRLNSPVVGMAADPDGEGYWLVGADGGVFAFDAPFYGSTGDVRLNSRVVGITAAPGGGGYYLVAADGGVFAFGPSARFVGSTGALKLNSPVVGIAVDRDDRGYWLFAADGGVFAFDARFSGSAAQARLHRPIVGGAPDFDGSGYWLVASDGGVFAFDAVFSGSAGGIRLSFPVVGIAADPDRRGYWLAASDGGVFAFDAVFSGSTGGIKLNQPVVAVTAAS